MSVKIHDTEVVLAKEENISDELFQKAIASKQFQDWVAETNSERTKGLVYKKITFQSVDLFGPRVGFIKFVSEVRNEFGTFVPGIVVLRGGSVCVLVIFECEGKQYSVITVQPRVAAAHFTFNEIPAGMIDDSHHFAGVAAKELKEECDLDIEEKDLIDLSAFACSHNQEKGIYMSPGLCDEFMKIYAYKTQITAEKLQQLEGKLTGNLEEGEMICLKIVQLNDLWRHCPDAKALSALYLWLLYAKQKLNSDVANDIC